MTDVFKKLNFKSQDPVLVLAAPKSFEAELRAIAGETTVHRAPKAGERYGFALAFAPMKADLLKEARGLLGCLGDEAVLWFAHPKQTSKLYASDLNRERCREALKPLQLRPVRQVAIDDDWSALRFTPTP